jgi:hypothetical protein
VRRVPGKLENGIDIEVVPDAQRNAQLVYPFVEHRSPPHARPSPDRFNGFPRVAIGRSLTQLDPAELEVTDEVPDPGPDGAARTSHGGGEGFSPVYGDKRLLPAAGINRDGSVPLDALQ